jgi:iron-sulfur cluster repair protein YtfE (RIC family)
MFHLAVRSAVDQHHRELESLLLQLCERATVEDPAGLRAFWDRFERELQSHLDHEERLVIPAFASINPDEAAELLREHDEIRRMLDDLRLGVELEFIDGSVAGDLASQLRAHAHHEERVLYPWASARFR